MIFFYIILSACLGAYVGKFMALTVHWLPKILLEELQEDSNTNRSPRDIFTWFFQNSKCFSCNKSFAWWQNVPIISYFLAEGKCSNCYKNSRLQSIFLEVGIAILFVITAIFSESFSQFIIVSIIVSLLTCCFITDYEYGILPDQFTLSLLWIGLIGSIFNFTISPRDAIIGAVSGYGLFWVINEFFRIYRGEDGMFPGDFKLNAGLGACLGIQQLIPILIIALGLVIVGTLVKYFYEEKPPLAVFIKQEIAYGCYTALIAIGAIYYNLYAS